MARARGLRTRHLIGVGQEEEDLQALLVLVVEDGQETVERKGMQRLLDSTRVVACDVQLEGPIEGLGPVDRLLKLHPLAPIRVLYKAAVAKVIEKRPYHFDS